MKKITILVLGIILVMIAVTAFAAPPNEDYQLLFADEFDGEALDTDVWAYRTNTKTGGVNKPENVRIEDGMMYVDYKKVDDIYTCGGVISKFSFPYGYYETRAKVFGGTGAFHSSFWLHGFGESTENVPDIAQRSATVEIDGFEINSHNPTSLSHGTYYNWSGESISRFRNAYTVKDWSKDYFVMGIEWLPDCVNFYVDGVLVSTNEDFGVYGPSHMWLTALAQPEDREHLIDDSLLPGYTEFDYYRFYQMPIKGLNLLGNGHFEYDRRNTSETYPRCFVIKGDTNAVHASTTFDAYEGLQCMVHSSEEEYEAFAGQKFEYIVPGKYTFSGMFKTSGNLTKARLVVYGKDGSIIASENIPALKDWTEVSLKDIDVEGYAYVAVESESDGGTSLMIDNLEFYIQEGVEYTETTEPDYLEYGYFPTKYTGGFYSKGIYDMEDATSVVGDWIKSSLGTDTYYAYYDEANSIEWELTADADDMYYFDIFRQINSNNMSHQKYTVYINDGEGTEYIIPTKDAEEGWTGVASLELKSGDKVRIKLSSGETKGFIRVSQIRLMRHEINCMYNTPIFMLDDVRLNYKGYVYLEDGSKKSWKPYFDSNEYYLPVAMLKDRIGLEFDAVGEYISATELKEKTGFDTIYRNGYLYLNDGSFELSDYAISYLAYDLHDLIDITKIKNVGQPMPESEGAAINYGISDAFKIGTWKHSSLGGGNDYTSFSGKAVWTDEVTKSGTYKLQFKSVAHENSCPSVKLSVFADSKNDTYLFNQKTGTNGWYDIGTYVLNENEPFTVLFENYNGADGLMRVGGLRLIPLPSGLTHSQNGKNITVGVLDFAEGTQGKILLAEYKTDGTFLTLHIKDASVSAQFTLEDAENDYKIMLWKSIDTMLPLCKHITK